MYDIEVAVVDYDGIFKANVIGITFSPTDASRPSPLEPGSEPSQDSGPRANPLH